MLQKRNVYVIILATTNDRYRHDQIDIIKKRCERSHLFFAFFDTYVVGGIGMLEKYDETVSEFATIVSKENDKGDVVVLVDKDDIKKKKDHVVS